MKLYRKIIHPYVEINGKKHPISGYKNKWFSEEAQQKIMDDIYYLYKNKEENKTNFFKRFHLKWEIRYEEVSFVTTMDDKIEK